MALSFIFWFVLVIIIVNAEIYFLAIIQNAQKSNFIFVENRIQKGVAIRNSFTIYY